MLFCKVTRLICKHKLHLNRPTPTRKGKKKNSTFNSNKTCKFPRNETHQENIQNLCGENSRRLLKSMRDLNKWNMTNWWIDFNCYKIPNSSQTKPWLQHKEEKRGKLDWLDIGSLNKATVIRISKAWGRQCFSNFHAHINLLGSC